MKQISLFDDDNDRLEEEAPIITSAAEVRELAREYFNLPPQPAKLAEPPLLKAKREQAARASGAAWARRGLVAKWAPYDIAKGYVRIHDPTTGEWHDLALKETPDWAQREARKRAGLYKAGDRHAYELTSAHMQELWDAKHPEEEGIVEDHPPEEFTY